MHRRDHMVSRAVLVHGPSWALLNESDQTISTFIYWLKSQNKKITKQNNGDHSHQVENERKLKGRNPSQILIYVVNKFLAS